MNKSIKIFPTSKALAESLALELVKQIRNADKSTSPFSIALSGGSTPELLFSTLGDKYASSVDWSTVHFFWVDERCVPPDNPESNFGMTNDALLKKIDILPGNIHRIQSEDDPEKEAERYSKEINDYVVHRNGLPSFNIILLGLGEDGHTASIFPGNQELFMSDRICTEAVHPVTGQKRITITGKVINNAEQIIFHVTGKGKAQIVKEIIDSEGSEKQLPASYVIPFKGTIAWYLDEAAGSMIRQV
jgi:6-phosphogluconolactonase